jgi:tetratricopeptide (TPR) repeat protein
MSEPIIPEDEGDAGELLDYAYFYLNRGELEQASELAMEARDLFDELQDASGAAESRWVLGFINHEMGDYHAALPILASAQQQFGLIGQIRQQCATLYLLARCHLGLERPNVNMAIYALNLAKTASKTKKDQFVPSSERRNPFIPDWETLNALIDQLLQELEERPKKTE